MRRRGVHNLRKPGGVEPPSPEWPDTFMSYPDQPTPIVLNNVHGTLENPYIIEELSFEYFYDVNGTGPGYNGGGGRPITLEDCSYITIRRIDTRKCTMGLVYALNCEDIRMEYCRTENVNWQHKDTPLNQIPHPGGGFGNDNNMNMYQMDKVDRFQAEHLKFRYGNTEDIFSHYQSSFGYGNDLRVEGAVATNQVTSDGSASVPWTSDSGTGMISTDDLGANCAVENSSFINAAQVLFQGGGNNNSYDNCVGIGEGYTSQPWNNGCQTWSSGPPCTGLSMTNMRTRYQRGDGSYGDYWWGCSTPLTTGSNFRDMALDIEDYRVLL